MKNFTFNPEDLAIGDEVNQQTTFSREELEVGRLVTEGGEASPTEDDDFIQRASKSVAPVYQRAIEKSGELFDYYTQGTNPSNTKLTRKEKLNFLNLTESDVAETPDKDLDKLLFQRRIKDAAGQYPNFVSKADAKALEQLFNNPEAVKTLNNNAMARASKATSLSKFYDSQKAVINRMMIHSNILYSPEYKNNFEQWALEFQILDSAVRANTINTPATQAYDERWNQYINDQINTWDLIKGTISDPLGSAEGALADAANSVSSIGASIAGRAAGAAAGGLTGSVAGPVGAAVGAAKGGIVGGFIGSAVAAVDGYIMEEMNNYRDENGNINWDGVRADFDKLVAKWRIEAAQQGITIGAIEGWLVPGVGGKIAKSLPAPVAKAISRVQSTKAGKVASTVVAKGTEEAIGEGAGGTVAKSMTDFQNGRLNKNTLKANVRGGVREAVAGGIVGGASGGVSLITSPAIDVVADTFTSKFKKKPVSEFTKEDSFEAEYEVKTSEGVVEELSLMESDIENASNLTGLTDAEKIKIYDDANSIDAEIELEDGNVIVVPAEPSVVTVNGADIETLLGEDVQTILDTVDPSKKDLIQAAIANGEDFELTYGEWVVSSSKLKDAHPTIATLWKDPESGLYGYEAEEVLSDAFEAIQAHVEANLQTAVDLPPLTPDASQALGGVSPEDMSTLYHGSNAAFDELDYSRGGGVVFFAESEEVAQRYANATHGGGRQDLGYPDIKLTHTSSGVEYYWDGEKYVSSDGQVVTTQELDSDFTPGFGYDTWEVSPVNSQVRGINIAKSKVLDTYTIAGLRTLEEAIRDRVVPSKNIKLRQIYDSLINSIQGSKDGPLFEDTFWGVTKFSKDERVTEALSVITDALTSEGYEGMRFKDDEHPSVAVFNPEIVATKQTSVVTKVYPTANINEVVMELADGSTHTIELYSNTSAVEVQALMDDLTKQFKNALSRSGRTSQEVIAASLEGIPIITRVLVKRAAALNIPLSDLKRSIKFKSDASSSSAYISIDFNKPDTLTYGVGRSAQRVSTVIHEFAHAILNFMILDAPKLQYALLNGTLSKEGQEYLDTINATSRLLGISDISAVKDHSRMALIDPVTGKPSRTNQARKPLTKFTYLHEKLATTMEVFLKKGELDTENMNEDVAKTLMYWRDLIPEDIVNRLESVSKEKGWTYSAEYHQAIDPTAEVAEVFHGMYAVNQAIETQAVPLFNFRMFPIELLGSKGPDLLSKIIETKHKAIASVYAKLYAKSVNARTKINTPEVLEEMNRDLYSFFNNTEGGNFLSDLNLLKSRIPESINPRLSAIQKFLNDRSGSKVEYNREATLEELELAVLEYPELIAGDLSFGQIVDNITTTFNEAKEGIREAKLKELGYLDNESIKEAVESSLAKVIPEILDNQMAEFVASYPAEAKQLFSAYMRNGKVSSRKLNKQINEATYETFLQRKVTDVAKAGRGGTLSPKIAGYLADIDRIAKNQTVPLFNQGRFIEALNSVYDAQLKSAELRHINREVPKLVGLLRAIDQYPSIEYQRATQGETHPEILERLRVVMDAVMNDKPFPATPIVNLAFPDIDAYIHVRTMQMLDALEGYSQGTVGATIALGEYARDMMNISRAAMKRENAIREGKKAVILNNARADILRSNKVVDFTSRFSANLHTINEYMSAYFPSQGAYYDSAVYKDIIYPIIRGEAQLKTRFEEMGREQYKYSKKSLKRKLEPMTLPNSGIEISNREDLISVLALMGSKSGFETLLRTHKAYDIDPLTNTAVLRVDGLKDDIKELYKTGVIDKSDVEFVNKLWADFDKLFDEVAPLYREVFGIKVGKIEPMPFKLGDLELNGGYFPFSSEEDFASLVDNFDQGRGFNDIYGFKTFRRIKERGAYRREPLKLGLSVVPSYIQASLREIYLKEHIELLKDLVWRDPQVKEHIDRTRPGAYGPMENGRPTGVLDDWIYEVEGQLRSDRDPRVKGILKYLHKNAVKVMYAYNFVGTPLSNILGGLPAALGLMGEGATIPVIGGRWRLLNNIMMAPVKLPSLMRVSEKSAVIRANKSELIQWLSDKDSAELFSPVTTAKKFEETVAFYGIRASQDILERLVWLSQYEHHLSVGDSEADAIRKADSLVLQAFGSYRNTDRSISQKSGFLGVFTDMVTKHVIQFARQQNLELKRDGPLWRRLYMTAGIHLMFMTSIYLTTHVLGKALRDARPGETEEEEDERLMSYMVKDYVSALMGPYGRIATSIVDTSDGRSVTLSPVENVLTRGKNAIRTAYLTNQTGYEMSGTDWQDAFDALTLFTGFSIFTGISRTDAAMDYLVLSEEERTAQRRQRDFARRYYGRQLK